MIKDKRAMSAIVTTVIMIALALVAIGIIWVVIQGILVEESDVIEAQADCTKIILEIEGTPDCTTTPGTCEVTIKRGAGGDAVDKFRVTVTDGTATDSDDVTKTLEALGTTTLTANYEVATVTGTITDVTVAAVIEDVACPNVAEAEL